MEWGCLGNKATPPYSLGLLLICFCFFELEGNVLLTKTKYIKILPVNLELLWAFLKLHYVRKYPYLSIGPLKSSFLLGKIQYEGQSAGNLGITQGSSETTREAYILKDNLFKFWFIGFLEGKGYFLINKNGKLEFKLVHTSREASVLFLIKKELGFGVVRIQDKVKNNHCFRVNDEKGLFKLISILNGNLFLDSKQREFKLWVDAYNKKYETSLVWPPAPRSSPWVSEGYVRGARDLKNDNKPDLSNSWLSGFTDAVGSFACIIKDKPDLNGLVKLSFTILKEGNYNQMVYLAEILKGKLHFNKGIYEITVNTTKLSRVINYLNIHRLKTEKSVVYLNFRKTYLLTKNKKSLTNEEIKLLSKYKNNLNRLDLKLS